MAKAKTKEDNKRAEWDEVQRAFRRAAIRRENESGFVRKLRIDLQGLKIRDDWLHDRAQTVERIARAVGDQPRENGEADYPVLLEQALDWARREYGVATSSTAPAVPYPKHGDALLLAALNLRAFNFASRRSIDDLHGGMPKHGPEASSLKRDAAALVKLGLLSSGRRLGGHYLTDEGRSRAERIAPVRD
ncbi:MAG: hypothetical protein AAF561_00375 [Planctomycetota bacterium]